MRRLLPCLFLLLLPTSAWATKDYKVGYGINGTALVFDSLTPFHRDSSWTYTSSLNAYSGTANAYALAGGAGISVDSRTDFVNGYGSQTGISLHALSMTDDFLITGPPGVTSVTGTFYGRVQGQGFVTGGWAGGINTGGSYSVWFTAAGHLFAGQMDWGIGYLHGSLGFSGFDQNPMDMTVALTGTYPVGTPFGVTSDCYLGTAHYGNSAVTPSILHSSCVGAPQGFASGIGNGTGLVMDLPAGYDLSSPSWGVVHNQITPTLGAPLDTPPAHLALSVASGNPSSGPALLRCALPASGHVELGIYDVAGRQVRNLASGWRAAGEQSVRWDGRDESGNAVAPGVYLAAIRAGGRSASVRIVRVK